VAISEYVRERTRRHWNRDAQVVYPPVDIDTFRPDGRPPEDFYLLVGAFVPYKRADLAAETFASLGRRLVVVGDPSAARAPRAPGITCSGRLEPEPRSSTAPPRAAIPGGGRDRGAGSAGVGRRDRVGRGGA
jgi:glycosyltransferase involved in cell wall biosynthesis